MSRPFHSHMLAPLTRHHPETLRLRHWVGTEVAAGLHSARNLLSSQAVCRLCRCDLTLVCSPVEHQLLQQHYGAPAHKLCSAPFFVQPAQRGAPGWEQRQHFMAIGNFRSAACCIGCRCIMLTTLDGGHAASMGRHLQLASLLAYEVEVSTLGADLSL